MAMQRYVVLPIEGFRSAEMQKGALQNVGHATAVRRRPGAAGQQGQMTVLDAIGDNGPRLVEMDEQSVLDLRLQHKARVRVIPIVYYSRAAIGWEAPQQILRQQTRPATRAQSILISVNDAKTGKGIKDARVVAFTSYRNREGDEALTDSNGRSSLQITSGTKIERLYVFSPHGYWGNYQTSVTLGRQYTIALDPIALNSPTLALTQFSSSLPANAGSSVRVGVIDSGVEKSHPAFGGRVVGGVNFVQTETENDPGARTDWGPSRVKGDHGTHVAGIIAGYDTATGFRGVAPDAQIMSYRVFPNDGGNATNYDIAKAIDRAVSDECDIINLSLGGAQPEETVRLAILEAVTKGVLVIAAAGNDYGGPVLFPAAHPGVVGVSAVGMKSSFPKASVETADVSKPSSTTHPDYFFAAFSNFGPAVDCIAPGVGIVSAVSGGNYATMSGTSMAAPAIAGFAAHVLATNRTVLAAKPQKERSPALFNLMMEQCKQLGLGLHYEGFGMPLLNGVAAPASGAPAAVSSPRVAAKKTAAKRAQKTAAVKRARKSRPA